MQPTGYIMHTGTAKGRGVFAIAKIQQGELIEACPVIQLDTLYPSLPEELQKVVFHWGVLANLPGISALALGYGSIYNHDNPANARYRASSDAQSLEIYAARDIAPDEEITVNYNATAGEPHSLKDNWFETTGVRPLTSH
jgi:uncharacterized protein